VDDEATNRAFVAVAHVNGDLAAVLAGPTNDLPAPARIRRRTPNGHVAEHEALRSRRAW
jgi:hypothetical protein